MPVGEQLEGVLVVHEQGRVSVSPVSKVSGQPVRLLNWAFISQWGGEPGLQVHDHNLLKKSISHHKLLAGSTDVSVSVVHSQGRVSSLVNLDGQEVAEINMSLNLGGRSNSWVRGSGEDIVALVSDFEHHYYKSKCN